MAHNDRDHPIAPVLSSALTCFHAQDEPTGSA